ncbi:MAG: hypothetical protein KKC42_01930, partial [Candidatus Omnitrophica bacterium]|nr:hypothetical protein [Candidatus Omnitrophota bacterium]
KIIILDEGREINDDSVRKMRDKILSEIARYHIFLNERNPNLFYPDVEKKDEIFINGINIFRFKTQHYRRVATHRTTFGKYIALWIENSKLIYCESTYALDDFLKEYVGNISYLLKEYKIEEFVPYKLNEMQKEDQEKDLEYIRNFLDTLK